MRALTSRNLLEKKPGKQLDIKNKLLKKLIGPAEMKGCWLAYGPEKNGKTWLALTLAKSMCEGQKLDYISAEEGTDGSFQAAARRVGISKTTKIRWREYIPLEKLIEIYKKPKTAHVIVIDNLTMYKDEFKDISLMKLLKELAETKLIIFIAHEERKEPYPAVARMAKKLAKVYFHIVGLKGEVVSRYGPGGEFVIDESKAELYWGSNDLETI